MKFLSRGRERRTRVLIFVLAILGAWAYYGTHISAEEARELLLRDLNEP